MASYLREQMQETGHQVGLLTADLTTEEREATIKSFREGRERVLISTNLCSRGLDIPQVNLVVNWDMPSTYNYEPDCETYLHRIGRSGRFGKQGLAINFMYEKESYILEAIEKEFDIKVPELNLEELGNITN